MPLHTSFPGLGHLHVELRTRYVVDLVAALDARDSTWMNAIKKGSRDVKDGRRLEVVRFDLGPLLKTEREDGVVAEAVKGMERRLEAMFMPLEFVQPPLIEKAVGVGLDDTRKDSGLDMLKAERVQDTTRMNRVKARVERTVIVSRTVRPLFLQTRR